jgi:exodeoxyribonuclease X
MADPLTLIRVVDTETTGIDDPAEMVEIGWTDVRLFPDGWQIERGPESVLVNPGMPIGFPAMAVHHITEDECRFGVDPDDIRETITQGADILCSHNWAFDSRFLKPRLPAICTFKAARTVWPDLQSHSNGSIRYELGLCLRDERTQPSHRAGPDTWVTAHILLKLLETHTVEQLLEISENPVRLLRMPGGNKHRGKFFSEIARIDPGYLQWVVDKSEFGEDVKFSAGAALRETR